jgi:ApbE superfamily uncharacterized protein (UPF0280 family)
MYEPRWYRKFTDNERFISFQVEWLETDLWVGVSKASYRQAIPVFILEEIKRLRQLLDNYIHSNQAFKNSLVPVPKDNEAPEEIQQMISASTIAGIGPMSAVAGLFAEYIGKSVIEKFGTDEIVVENGGDLFVFVKKDIDILVYAGNSALSNKIAVTIPHHYTPLGLCTSSGTVGHSLSFGKADAVMVACTNTTLADSLATRFGNEVKAPADIAYALNLSETFDEIVSMIIIVQDKIGIRGKLGIKPFVEG